MSDQKSVGRARAAKILTFFVIITFVAAAAACLLLWSTPFKEKGKTLKSGSAASDTPEKLANSETTAWGGRYCNFLVAGIDNTKSLTDVIMVVSINNTTGKINILQIPRDTYAGDEIPTYKYNAVYGHHAKGVSGMETLKAQVESDFGIQINYYAAITTKGLRDVVDAAGGVDLNVPIDMNYDDKAQNLHIHLQKGFQHLNGSQTEQFVRYRKGWADGDLGRLDAQKLFLAAFGSKLRDMNTFSLTTKILPALIPPNFTTDLTTLQMIQYGLATKKISLYNISVYTVPGEPFTYRKNSLYSVHKKELLAVMNKAFVPAGTTLTPKDLHIIQKANTGEESQSNEQNDFSTILDKQQQTESSSSGGASSK